MLTAEQEHIIEDALADMVMGHEGTVIQRKKKHMAVIRAACHDSGLEAASDILHDLAMTAVGMVNLKEVIEATPALNNILTRVGHWLVLQHERRTL